MSLLRLNAWYIEDSRNFCLGLLSSALSFFCIENLNTLDAEIDGIAYDWQFTIRLCVSPL